MKNEIPRPTQSELEILQLLWKNGPSTVRFINDKLNEKRVTGYTTTLKIMQLMLMKSMLRREEKGSVHIYKAVLKEEETQGLLLDLFLETAFSGSASKLIIQALGNSKTTKKELDAVRKFLNTIKPDKE